MNAWKVLLIGGSSAVGKSFLARQLSDKFHIPLTEVDDIRIALQQVVDKHFNPDLFFFLSKPYSELLKVYSSEELVSKLLKVGEEVWPSLDALISKHIVCNEPIIFEGDGIIPNLLAKRDQSDVKSIFIWDNTENLRTRSTNRIRGEGTEGNLEEKQAIFSADFGEELKKQAKTHGFDLIEATPLDTLFDRVVKVLEQHAHL